MRENISAVIFDMDGVLLDNNDWHLRSWLAYAEKRNIPLKAEDAYTRVFGKTNREIILEAFPDCDENTISAWSLEKEALYREMYQPHFALPEGLRDFLELLQEKKIPMAVASNAPMENIRFTLDSGMLNSFFDVLVWADLVERPKPHPDIYLKASSLLGFEPSQCLVIEDSPTGIRAALAAGCIPLAITSTYQQEELAAYTSLIAGSFPEISRYLFTPGS
jgi:HAD superfamily hydrolase (TIGR01509 family)